MIGKRLLQLRKSLSLTQEALAKAFGVHGKLTVHRWEAGLREPSETIRRLVLLLNELPEAEARRFLAKLESYGSRK
jgi:transcriptional regulator with XRE-family HTH domain